MILRIAGFLAAAILLTACASLPPPQTVPSVDLARYAGSWHEIESFPNWFQSGCANTKAEYSPLPGGRIPKSGNTVAIDPDGESHHVAVVGIQLDLARNAA